MEFCLENLHVDIGIPRLHICQQAPSPFSKYDVVKRILSYEDYWYASRANSVVGWTVDYQKNTFELIPPRSIPQVPQAHKWESLLRNGNIIKVCMEI